MDWTLLLSNSTIDLYTKYCVGGVQGLVKYVLRKLLFMLLSLFILASATFFLMKAIPGDPFTSEKKVTPEIRALLEVKYGLDKPMYEQYLKYMGGIVKGD